MAPSYMGQSEPERRTWPNKLEYHMSLFSQALGLCTFWRFPYMAYENGGAPFVYVFFLLYLLVGVPLVFLEMAWGQYSNLAPPQGFSILPIMQGVGGCMILMSLAVVLYFGVASYYLMLYLTASLSSPLPYNSCGNVWNTDQCQIILSPNCVAPGAEGLTYKQGVHGIETDDGEFIKKQLCNYTNGEIIPTNPAIEYWQNNLAINGAVCRNLPQISEALMGSSNVLLLPMIAIGIFILIRFIVAMFALASSVRFTGKTAYALCTVPFAVSVMLLVRCLTLEQATRGLEYLFVPTDMESMIAPKVWKDAISQVFLSLLVTWGGLFTWSSYNRFYNKYEVDASLLIVTTPILSLLSAISMFSVIGYLSYIRDVPLEDALNGIKGPVAPFVAYSEALSRMWGNPVPWSVGVFTSMFVLSTASILPGIECLLSSVSDSLSSFRGAVLRVISGMLVLLFTLTIYYGVPCIVEGSALQYIEFMDTLTLPICCIVIALPELLMITFAFGVKLLRTNIKAMTNNNCLKRIFWPIMWGGVTPFVLLLCLSYVIVGAVRDGLHTLAPSLPDGVSRMGSLTGWTPLATFVFCALVFFSILFTAIFKIARARGSCTEKLQDATTPASLGRSSIHTNGRGRAGRSNGDVYMADYVGHQDTNEVLLEDDIVTTV